MIRLRVTLCLGLAVLMPSLAAAQTVEIEHKAVGCIVVGKYPKMNACFTPAANLARARVYFRPEGVPSWYYVEMKSDQPCFAGTLPKPGKKLVGKKIEYYVEGQDKAFNAGRTAEYDPIVVKSAQECKKNVPVAPFLNNATVAVFPAVPAGFVGGGIGTAAIVGIVGAGAAAAGTAAVVASNNNDTTTTTIVAGVNTTTTIVTTTTLPPTTTLPKTNHAPSIVLTTNPDPATGQGPLTVTFDTCKSTDPDGDPLKFFFDFGDGATASGSCNVSHTYPVAPFRESSTVRAASQTYNASGSVVDPSGDSSTKDKKVTVESGRSGGCPKLTVDLSPPPGSNFSCAPLSVKAVSNGTRVTFCAVAVDFSNCPLSFAPQSSGTSAAGASSMACAEGTRVGTSFGADLTLTGFQCYAISAQARDECGASEIGGPAFVFNDTFCYFAASGLRKDVGRTTVWSSDLSVEGGRLQVVVNGASPAFPGSGRGFGTARLVDGENRVEAVLVDSAGKAGLWHIDLRPSEAILEGSLRVISGQVELLGPSSATFRLSGKAGERIVFTFMKK
jgi:hypothetical protein